MRRRKAHPLVWVVAVIAAIVGAYWQRGDHAGKTDRTNGTYRTEGTNRSRAAEAPKPAAETRRAEAPAVDAAGVPAEEQAELQQTLDLIARGGPFPHKQDGTVFGNREGHLPPQPRGYYREYTVRTPGARTRGARRVVRGKGGETYYTRDHYQTFTRIDE
ncbi:MAG TPA: ribonuclease domain-containing protein [Thermoanaerobaculia bacterium]